MVVVTAIIIFPLLKLIVQISYFSLDRIGRLGFDQHRGNIWHGFDIFRSAVSQIRARIADSDVILQP